MAGEIRVRAVDWVAPLPQGLVADYSTPDGDVFVSTVLVPLVCVRCPSTRSHIVQGRWGDELTLICIRCGTDWTGRWAGIGDDDGAASRALLKQIIVESGFTPGTGVGDTIGDIRDEFHAGLWTPSRIDQRLADALPLTVQGDHGGTGPEAIAQCMVSTLPDWRLRSLRFSEALARTIGLLRAPGAGTDTETLDVLDSVMGLARTIAALEPGDLRHEPEAQIES
ncbi:hypothetical protein [Streptomyces novaecaesareae]|uniref:hypothetical protein n=1 Tax=Streptomyces novaecaesareae TaxID=68244 RepID=UPI0012FF4F42|nr:hypothetical protein [Streptomyces novaecaesareae]